MAIQERMASWKTEIDGLKENNNNNKAVIKKCDVGELLCLNDEEMMRPMEEGEVVGEAEKPNDLLEAQEEEQKADVGAQADKARPKEDNERVLEEMKREIERLRLENVKLRMEKSAVTEST